MDSYIMIGIRKKTKDDLDNMKELYRWKYDIDDDFKITYNYILKKMIKEVRVEWDDK